METLDIILTNVISFMSGIFLGYFLNYKMYNKNNTDMEEKIIEKEFDKTKKVEKYESPVQTLPTAPPFPVQAFALNPECNQPKVNKITLTSE